MEQTKIVLCDTNVLIEFYKNNQDIVKTLKKIGQDNIAISSITTGELIYGALNKKELHKIMNDVKHLTLLDIDNNISKKFLELMATYSLSHNLALPDAFIAATSLTYNIPLFTLNVRDFRFIKDLILYKT